MQAANLIAPLFAGIRRAAHPLASDPGECLEGLHFGAAIDQSVGGSLAAAHNRWDNRSEEHTSELQSHSDLVCRLLLEKKKTPDKSWNGRRVKANITVKRFRVGIISNISPNKTNLSRGVDRCIDLKAMTKTNITSINGQ